MIEQEFTHIEGEEGNPNPIIQKRPLLQSLWENKVNILSVCIILAVYATFPLVFTGELTHDQTFTDLGIKSFLLGMFLYAGVVGSTYLAKGVSRLADRFGDFIGSAYRDINGH